MTIKILVVDDEALIRESMQANLNHAGYETHTASNGRDALLELDCDNYDLLITDLIMDNISGLELIKTVKETTPTLPVIIMTGYGELKSAIEALQLGTADYILKPYNNDQLMLTISNCLEQQELQKKIKVHENFLPICCVCKSIRDDAGKEPGTGDWFSIEEYLQQTAGVKLSHTFCDKCMLKQKEEIMELKRKLKG